MPTIHIEIDDAVLPLVEWETLQPRLLAAVEATLALCERQDATLTLVLTHDEEVKTLNWEYREINAPTDVLSFAMTETTTISDSDSDPGDEGENEAEGIAETEEAGESEADGEQNGEETGMTAASGMNASPAFVIAEEAADELSGYVGDIVIAVPYSQRQAQRFGNSLTGELCLLAVHGTLHLLGHDHATPATEAQMWAMQDQVLASLGEAALARREFDE